MGTPEAAQSEQTEIVQLRQQVAELEARCQAVTAERDKLQAQLDGWTRERTADPFYIPAETLDAWQRWAEPRITGNAPENVGSRAMLTLIEAYRHAQDAYTGSAALDQFRQVLGAAPREGR